MKKNNVVDSIAFLYISLPVLIFFFGWLHIGYALVLSGLLLFGVVSHLKRPLADVDLSSAPVAVSRGQWLVVAGLAFLWVFFSGIGGFANQDWDHHFRNALFRDLIGQQWPVYYDFPATYPETELANHHSALNYYLTFWLPAALAGKIGGAGVANVFLLGWTYAGILLILYYLNRLVGFRYSLIVSLLFMGWSGLDVLGRLIMQPLDSFTTFQLEAYYKYAYVAFTSDLYNVFNQAIPTWLITLWVFNNRNRLNLLPVAFLFAYAPFPFIGLVLLYYSYYLLDTFRRSNYRISDFLSVLFGELRRVETVVALLCLLLPYALFYGAHTSSVPSAFFWSRFLEGTRRMKLQLIVFYFVTFFLEAGVYFFTIILVSRKTYQSNKLLFWLCFGMLLFIPLWVVGAGNDFASRGSMPFLLMLCVMTINALLDAVDNRVSVSRLAIPAFALLMAWVTPTVAIIDGIAFRKPPELRDIIVSFSDPQVSRANNMHGTYPSLANYYAHEPKQHFFYKYLTKK